MVEHQPSLILQPPSIYLPVRLAPNPWRFATASSLPSTVIHGIISPNRIAVSYISNCLQTFICFTFISLKNHYLHHLALVLLLSLLGHLGCTGPGVSVPAADHLRLLADPYQAPTLRIQALDKLQQAHLSPAQSAQLNQTLADILARGQGDSLIVRQASLTALIARADSSTTHQLGLAALVTQDSMRTELAIALAGRYDPNALNYLTVIWADQLPLADQSHRELVMAQNIVDEQLIRQGFASSHPDDCGPAYALLNLVVTTDNPVNVRAAALKCLLHVTGRSNTLQTLDDLAAQYTVQQELTINDHFLSQVFWWAENYQYLPTNIPRLMQCNHVLSNLSENDLDTLAARWRTISQDQPSNATPQNFNVADAYVLVNTTDTTISLSRCQLVQRITQQLGQLDHAYRPASYTGSPDEYPEDFTSQYNYLSYNDLLNISLLLDTLSQPEAQQHLQQILTADIAEIHSEAGGLCFLTDQQRVSFVPYPSANANDRHYVDSGQALRDGIFCFARWHCHADVWAGTELAGPSPDDLVYAAYYNCPLIVISLLEQNAFGVDYCTPEGVVIDLGIY
ncbi:MAG: hypothetical protein JW936_02195 [Sedimentisphaerales bacterium]|nr:hypothetical protein [Sedimentisphaerales bacterium]